MSWQTHRLVLAVRDIGRSLGVNRLIAPMLQGRGYETRYDEQFSGFLRGGDRVWDIGANVGHYTKTFSGIVGLSGFVYAFEPSPVNFIRLRHECSPLPNVALLELALGNTNGKVSFEQGADELGATSRIGVLGSEVFVDVRTGDEAVRLGIAEIPNAVKIDVEGFEWEVLEGMESVLQNSAVRLFGVEVHFGILRRRGLADVPRRIEEIFLRNRFSTTWSDSSHIIAVRV